MLLDNKTVVLGVTGGIAAYKALELTSKLVKSGAQVKVIMTKSAVEFVAPLSFQSLSGNPVAIDTFDEPKSWEIRHISLAKAADVFAIVPCTANIIGKIAGGIADDMLTTTVMATKAPVLIAPAMNTNMFENPIVQDNIKKLSEKYHCYHFVMPESGRLACGDTGNGKLAGIDVIFENIAKLALLDSADLNGKKIVISAGATQEKIDPVRFITNHSTGKMGFALARAAMLRGGQVTLVAGHNSCEPITGIKTIDVSSADEMRSSIINESESADIIIMAAAVADFKPSAVSENKIKKKNLNDMSIALSKNPDILKELGEKFDDKKTIVGFAMETEDLIKNASEKCVNKNVDFIVANNLKTTGAGFGTDTNVASLIDRYGNISELPLMDKFELSNIILDKALSINKSK